MPAFFFFRLGEKRGKTARVAVVGCEAEELEEFGGAVRYEQAGSTGRAFSCGIGRLPVCLCL